MEGNGVIRPTKSFGTVPQGQPETPTGPFLPGEIHKRESYK